MKNQIRELIKVKTPKFYNKLKIFVERIYEINLKFTFYMLKLLIYTIKSEVRITCYSGNDGGGGQILRILSVAAFCDYLGIKFVFTPIRTIDFTPDSYSITDWVIEWNSIINFQDIYEINNDYKLGISNLTNIFLLVFTKTKLVVMRDAMKFSLLYPNQFSKLINKYNLSLRNINEIKSLDFAFHIRKAIVNEFHPAYHRELARELNKEKIVSDFNRVLIDNDLEMYNGRVFVNKIDDSINALLSEFNKIRFDSETDAITAIKLMSKAKVLIVAHSAMSYIAGLFNNNKIYYYRSNWRQKGLSEWIPLD